MIYIIRLASLIAVFLLGMVTSYAKDLAATPNHAFDQVKIAYAHDQCSFKFSPVDFCDDRHVFEIKKAIATEAANFNGHYILLSINEWKPSAHYGDSLVVIDTLTGIVYPLPFDYYSGQINMKNSHMLKKPNLNFSLKSNKICIDGSILVYRAMTNGNFCFEFDGEKFTGYQTEYMR
ncbi:MULTISPECIES: hypothetical protein [Paraburkholderia]|uniref:hypothetical protein n=1 Tax=Paraburkholderia TaxID=1822464 RepID=UPI00035DFE9B|nr:MULTISPECIES: hypothetical protein [Paraburkholderia]MDH6147998.1 hypothetical protein [Paraburkholderia sp. WSM4179]